MRSIVLLAVAVACVLAQPPSATQSPTFNSWYPSNSPLCNRPGFKLVDDTSYYQGNTSVTKAICVLNYYDVCATVSGVQPCDTYGSVCVSSNSNWNDYVYNPNSANVMASKPQVCASEGAFWHPETAIISVAQPVVSFFVALKGLIFVLHASSARGVSVIVRVILVGQFFWCTLLFFSFYYLNALIALLASYGAVGLYAAKPETKKSAQTQAEKEAEDKANAEAVRDYRTGVAFGLIILFSVLLWFTHWNGLGEIQHHSRFVDNIVSYEQICDNYYRGYFGYPLQLHGPWDSPNWITTGYCMREWLAAEYFFIILVKLQIVLLIVYGAYEIRAGGETQPEKEEQQPATQ